MRRISILIVVDPARARLWQRQAIEDLRALGHEVMLSKAARSEPLPAILGALLQMETTLYRLKGRTQASATPGGAWRDIADDSHNGFQPDLIVDLTTRAAGPSRTRTLRILYSGSAHEEALFLDLLSGRPPVVGIVDSNSPNQALSLHPAIEDPFRLTLALDQIGAHLGELLIRAVAEAMQRPAIGGDATPDTDAFGGWTVGRSMETLRARAASVIGRLGRRGPHWYVGWRRISGDAVQDTLTIPAGGWTRLPDDGKRFYADPFLMRHQGRDWMFVEEFPFATRKGVLSVVEIGASGPMGSPRPFLELPHHLSYPFVFEDAGDFWLIPESCTARRVELYRAREFPHVWDLDAVLIDSEEVSDATLVKRDGRYFLFGTTSSPGRSSWDTLKIWQADRLRGPWTPCARGPALVDARSARPAGNFFSRGGELWRPAQDCSAGYGGALALARVDRLDPDGFAQSVRAVLKPNADWPGIGLHTLNAAHGLEVVDGCSG